MAHDVFISYSARDKVVADMVCSTLESRKIRCWIAPRDVRPSQTWAGAVVDAINKSAVFVLVFSGEANNSEYVRREITRAANVSIPIIPFRIEDTQPSGDVGFFISDVHWLDALTPPLEAHLQRLADIVEEIIHPEAAPTSSERRPDVPTEQPARARLRRRLPKKIVIGLAVAAVLVGAISAFLSFYLAGGSTSSKASSGAASTATSSTSSGPTSLQTGTALFYLHDLFTYWTLTGDLRTDSNNHLLSALNSILTENGISNPSATMQAWYGDGIDIAIHDNVCKTKPQCSFLYFPVKGPFEKLSEAESYRRLWEQAIKEKDKNLLSAYKSDLGLAMTKAFGAKREKDLIKTWDKSSGA